MSISKGALRPNNEEPRRSGKTTRGTTNYQISISDKSNTIHGHRVQFLVAHGLAQHRADLVADLAWGEAA